MSVRGILFQGHRVQNAMGSGNEKRELKLKDYMRQILDFVLQALLVETGILHSASA